MTRTAFPVARTPLYHWHAAHGVQFVGREGVQLPAVYSTVEAEAAAARDGIGLAEISAGAKLRLDGAGVPAVAAGFSSDQATVQARSVAVFDADGPALACRLAERSLLLLGSKIDTSALSRRVPESADIVTTDVTWASAGLLLVGPQGEALLRRLTSFDIAALRTPAGACVETSLAGVHALLIHPPRGSVDEMRLYIAADVGEYVWDTLLQVGRDLGITPVGLQCLAALGLPHVL